MSKNNLGSTINVNSLMNPKASSSNLFQPRVLLIKHEKLLWKDIETVFPIDAHEVFISEQEATDFFPIFLNNLVKKGVLDGEQLFTKDNTINENYIKTAVVTLTITRLALE